MGKVTSVQRINAKVPLVKFVHVQTGRQVDMSFDQDSGLDSGAAAKLLMRQMPPVRPSTHSGEGKLVFSFV